jgi:hypothetical protein
MTNPVAELLRSAHPAMHASAPPGYRCSDCTMDEEPCPPCYLAWWTKRHPNTIHAPELAQQVIARHVLALRQLVDIWDHIKAGVGEFRGEMRAMDDAMDAVRVALTQARST